jgi:GTP-binding protein
MKKKARALKKAAGATPLIVSAASGEGVKEVLRALAAEVRNLRGQTKEEARPEKASSRGWRP